MCFVSSEVSLEWFRLLSVSPSRLCPGTPSAPAPGPLPTLDSGLCAPQPIGHGSVLRKNKTGPCRITLMRGENRIRPEYQQGKSDYRQGSIPFGSLLRFLIVRRCLFPSPGFI